MERLRRVFTAVGETVAEHPVATVAVALALVSVSVAGAAGITSVTGNDAFVSEDPTLNTYQESFDRKTVAVLVDGDVTEPSTLRAVDRFDRRMSGVEDVGTVVTPADEVRAAYSRVPGSSARIRDVVDTSETTVVSVVLEPDLSQEEQRVDPTGVGDAFRAGFLAGLGWGATLWLVAAGMVMPLWLQVVGVPAPFPNLSPPGLGSHLVWGGVLGTAVVALDERRGDREY